MRYLIAILVALSATAPAVASSGTVSSPSMNDSWTSGSAGFSVTNSACYSPCSWRAVADTVPALYQCPTEPFLEGNIAWLSGDYMQPGTVAVPSINFTGPGFPTRICLYLDRRAAGDVYLLAVDLRLDENGVAEVFSPTIADPAPPLPPPPVAKVVRKHHHRHHSGRVRKRGTQ